MTWLQSVLFKKDFIYLLLERGEGREKDRERNTWPTTQACALTRTRTSDLLVHRLVLNPLSHTGQDYSMYS